MNVYLRKVNIWTQSLDSNIVYQASALVPGNYPNTFLLSPLAAIIGKTFNKDTTDKRPWR